MHAKGRGGGGMGHVCSLEYFIKIVQSGAFYIIYDVKINKVINEPVHEISNNVAF